MQLVDRTQPTSQANYRSNQIEAQTTPYPTRNEYQQTEKSKPNVGANAVQHCHTTTTVMTAIEDEFEHTKPSQWLPRWRTRGGTTEGILNLN